MGLNEHWEEVAARVRDRVRCVMFELPLLRLRGGQCSIDGATELTAKFLGEYSRRPAVLVGNSFGTGLLWGGVTIASVIGVIALSLLELFVALLQAYIFTFLTALFMGMSLHHAEQH